MKDTAPKEQGILLIAAVFGFIGGAVAYVAYGWGLASAGLVALLVALVVAVALWLGWREPKGLPKGPVNLDPKAPNRGGGAAPTQTHGGGAAPTQTHGADPAGNTPPAATPAARGNETAGEKRARPVASAAAPAADAPAPHAAGDAAAQGGAGRGDTAAAGLKPSARLAGQEDMASRKGSWKYDAKPGASEADARPDAATGATAHPGAAGASVADTATPVGAMNGEQAAAIAAREDTPDSDGDTTAPDVGDKPQMLSAPREGGADNLKEIKGVGPKLENTLHELGVYHFDQIAGWSATEVAWMDNNLRGFKGRVSRDGWTEQAKILASGGETEFSTRVDKGGVY
ncbi:hypothetical protein ACOI1H_03895 [Loktanella sp. DJP18]|uniref:hypothetical protein n=1 Tax=Loktanella sp. DJP18 TaxID=3409788 RepID=UPI003BB60D3B